MRMMVNTRMGGLDGVRFEPRMLKSRRFHGEGA